MLNAAPVTFLFHDFGRTPLNLILLFPEDLIHGTNRARLEGRRLKHVLEVHRAKINDELCVGLMNDRIGTGRINVLNGSFLEMDVRLEAYAARTLARYAYSRASSA